MMHTEIEIKFSIYQDIESSLLNLLNTMYIVNQYTEQLHNAYFDTATLNLRQLNMGLRIRRGDQLCEQTLKYQGTTVGGLHTQGEYNRPIHSHTPVLADFPIELWPSHAERELIQTRLITLFHTNFSRRSWLILWQDAEIELAWDQGSIIANQQQEPINELELELKSGNTTALFSFARQIATLGGLSLESRSKAQRGYILAGLNTRQQPSELPSATGLNSADLISHTFGHWQFHEQDWLTSFHQQIANTPALNLLLTAIALINRSSQTLSSPPVWLPSLQEIYQTLSRLTSVTPLPVDTTDTLTALMLSPNYVTLQLAIISWLHEQAISN